MRVEESDEVRTNKPRIVRARVRQVVRRLNLSLHFPCRISTQSPSHPPTIYPYFFFASHPSQKPSFFHHHPGRHMPHPSRYPRALHLLGYTYLVSKNKPNSYPRLRSRPLSNGYLCRVPGRNWYWTTVFFIARHRLSVGTAP
ncbi:hypothetical protein LX36DRAFT_10632 [Colletotrichum falcatum]|nr:hypothetical protein LX36DRAFT_10632 [Colletotrichum falcatum]